MLKSETGGLQPPTQSTAPGPPISILQQLVRDEHSSPTCCTGSESALAKTPGHVRAC